MVVAGSLLFSHEVGPHSYSGYKSQYKAFCREQLEKDAWSFHLLNPVHCQLSPVYTKCKIFMCHSILTPTGGNEIPALKAAATVLTRSYNAFQRSPVVFQLVPAVGIIAFAAWGLGPLVCLCRIIFLQKTDSSWKKSNAHHVLTSYVQPLLLWSGAALICRVLDPVILPTEASQAVKQRLLNFIRSLSTVVTFAYCLSGLIQQTQKFFVETEGSTDERDVGVEFAGKAVYTAVWIAGVSLFMELLGFSTQKWLTAGGLGTVLLTLAGREIFTNFLSSVMIHATRPFVLNEWIQTKVQGYEVSGTVEHMGWWSPTIIRGDDREAVHIPNHKFTVNVVRNLSQKTHWRIKTHLAISHLDVNKINNIVADMRKVLAKNPQIEQQRLHRRIFLDRIDPESQALLIMVSCFVKTSRFEEHLCVKEAILLDLLRVISHHRARLATPIRTMQNTYGEPDVENIPFDDIIFTRTRSAMNHPFLLIDDKIKGLTRSDSKIDTSDGSTSNSSLDNTETDNKNTSVSLEDNIVLGVALDGSKRTLPIEEDMAHSPLMNEEAKELAACRNGNGPTTPGKKKNDDQVPPVPGSVPSDQREKKR